MPGTAKAVTRHPPFLWGFTVMTLLVFWDSQHNLHRFYQSFSYIRDYQIPAHRSLISGTFLLSASLSAPVKTRM